MQIRNYILTCLIIKRLSPFHKYLNARKLAVRSSTDTHYLYVDMHARTDTYAALAKLFIIRVPIDETFAILQLQWNLCDSNWRLCKNLA